MLVGEQESFLDWAKVSGRVAASRFHKLTVLELEESVVLSDVNGDTRFPPAHCSVACGVRVVWLARRQWVDWASG